MVRPLTRINWWYSAGARVGHKMVEIKTTLKIRPMASPIHTVLRSKGRCWRIS